MLPDRKMWLICTIPCEISLAAIVLGVVNPGLTWGIILTKRREHFCIGHKRLIEPGLRIFPGKFCQELYSG